MNRKSIEDSFRAKLDLWCEERQVNTYLNVVIEEEHLGLYAFTGALNTCYLADWRGYFDTPEGEDLTEYNQLIEELKPHPKSWLLSDHSSMLGMSEGHMDWVSDVLFPELAQEGLCAEVLIDSPSLHLNSFMIRMIEAYRKGNTSEHAVKFPLVPNFFTGMDKLVELAQPDLLRSN